MKRLSEVNSTIYSDEAIIYGAKVVTFNILTIVIIFLTSLFYSKLTYGLSFILFFSPMRIINGGAHTKNPIICLFLTTSMFIISLQIFNYFMTIKNIYLLISFLIFGVSFLLKNKSINQNVIIVTGIIALGLSLIFNDRTFYLGYLISFYLFEFLYLIKK